MDTSTTFTVSENPDRNRTAFSSSFPAMFTRDDHSDFHLQGRYSLLSRPISEMRSTCPSPTRTFESFPQSRLACSPVTPREQVGANIVSDLYQFGDESSRMSEQGWEWPGEDEDANRERPSFDDREAARDSLPCDTFPTRVIPTSNLSNFAQSDSFPSSTSFRAPSQDLSSPQTAWKASEDRFKILESADQFFGEDRARQLTATDFARSLAHGGTDWEEMAEASSPHGAIAEENSHAGLGLPELGPDPHLPRLPSLASLDFFSYEQYLPFGLPTGTHSPYLRDPTLFDNSPSSFPTSREEHPSTLDHPIYFPRPLSSSGVRFPVPCVWDHPPPDYPRVPNTSMPFPAFDSDQHSSLLPSFSINSAPPLLESFPFDTLGTSYFGLEGASPIVPPPSVLGDHRRHSWPLDPFHLPVSFEPHSSLLVDLPSASEYPGRPQGATIKEKGETSEGAKALIGCNPGVNRSIPSSPTSSTTHRKSTAPMKRKVRQDTTEGQDGGIAQKGGALDGQEETTQATEEKAAVAQVGPRTRGKGKRVDEEEAKDGQRQDRKSSLRTRSSSTERPRTRPRLTLPAVVYEEYEEDPNEWESKSEFWAPFRKSSSLINEEARDVEFSVSIANPSSCVFDTEVESWLTYRRNFLSFSPSVTFDTPTLLSELHTPKSEPKVSSLKATVEAFTFPRRSNVELLQFDALRSLEKATPVAPQRLSPEQKRRKKSKNESISSVPKPASTYSTPFSRIQFRASTANHPKASAETSHEYFSLTVKLAAVHEDGNETTLGRFNSAKLVVRGRSKGNFEAAKKRKVDAPAKKRESLSKPGQGKEGDGMALKGKGSSAASNMEPIGTRTRRSMNLAAPI